MKNHQGTQMDRKANHTQSGKMGTAKLTLSVPTQCVTPSARSARRWPQALSFIVSELCTHLSSSTQRVQRLPTTLLREQIQSTVGCMWRTSSTTWLTASISTRLHSMPALPSIWTMFERNSGRFRRRVVPVLITQTQILIQRDASRSFRMKNCAMPCIPEKHP